MNFLPIKARCGLGSIYVVLFIVFFPTTMSASAKFHEEASDICPGSPSSAHAKCKLEVLFPNNSCQQVKDEVVSRLQGKNGWHDPHNNGTYVLEDASPSSDGNFLAFSRITANQKYTDKIHMKFSPSSSSDDSGCILLACSESQVTSILDFSTNYCNIRNLYCNQNDDHCPIIDQELTYVESCLLYTSPSPRD